MGETATIEEKAKTMGHISKEDWKGDPGAWRPADDFVERGENIVPIMKKRLDDFEKKFEQSQKENKIIIAANTREVEEAKTAAFNLATADYNAKLKALDVKEMEAFSDGDAEAFTKVKKEKESLKEPVKPVEKVVPSSKNIEFEDWNKKETWYQNDNPEDTLTMEADVQAVALRKRFPGKPTAEILKMATNNVKKLHPDKFENPRRNEAGVVESSDGSTSKTGDNTFASLPKSAKDSFRKLEAQFKLKGRTYKKEDYARDWHDQ